MRQHSLRMSPITIAILVTSLGTVGSVPTSTLAQAQDSLIEEVVQEAGGNDGEVRGQGRGWWREKVS